MNIPTKVKVGFRTFEIEYNEEWDCTRGDNYGDITYHTKKIRISDTIDEAEQKVTLLHEIIHAMSRLRGDDMKENINEEVIAVGLSELLFTVMQNNRKVFKWILSK